MLGYSVDQLMAGVEPQARRDRELICRCLDAIGVYAGERTKDDAGFSEISNLRAVVSHLANYWYLDHGEDARPIEGFLRDFDDRIETAKTGTESAGISPQTYYDAVHGLHRSGTVMAADQGVWAIEHIIALNGLIKEIGAYWGFDPDLANGLSAQVENEAWGLLPGQPVSGMEVKGYEVRRAVLFDNDQGFVLAEIADGAEGIALAENPGKPQPFAVWQFSLKGDMPDCYRLHYIGTQAEAMNDYKYHADRYIPKHAVAVTDLPTAWICQTQSSADKEKAVTPQSQGHRQSEKPSVLKQIRESREAPKLPHREKTPDPHKHRNGEEL